MENITNITHINKDRSNNRKINFGTLNVRGCQEDYEIKTACRDANRYNIQILGITETHIKGDEETIVLEIEDEKQKTKREYYCYFGGIKDDNVFSGVGVIIEKEMAPKFNRITDRVCTAEITESNGHKIIIIVCYAPTLIASEKKPEKREEFYETLDKILYKEKKSKNTVILLGDMNAKTGTGYQQYSENMGKYGKGMLNNNGKHLLDLAKRNEMLLTNTIFPHKKAHRTTWTAPERKKDVLHHDGTKRKNPYRNQIDYILVKCNHRRLITNSRSYAGIETETDHKLVIMNMNLDWWKLPKNTKKREKKINIKNLSNADMRTSYKNTVKRQMNKILETDNPDEKWNKITEICLKSAEEALGFEERTKNKLNNIEIEKLSKKQKKLKNDIEATIDKEKRQELKTGRNRIMNEIKVLVKHTKDQELEKELKDIEGKHNNANKCHEAVRLLKRKGVKKPLKIMNTKGQTVSNEEEQVKIITEYFKETFEKPNITTTQYKPVEMKKPFTSEEIKKATKKLKNNKSAGPDKMKAELMKYAPDEIYDQIADLLQATSKGEQYPKVIKKGNLVPLQKPPKEKARVNVRPVVLLSVLRKIMALCIIDRTWERLKTAIPKEQAAYQAGRSTTEQVYTIKTLVEKAITTSNYEIFLLMFDMSKAFDTVNRNKLMELLEDLLDEDEIYIMNLLIMDVVMNVKLGDEEGEDITTNVGVVQ